MSVRLEYRIAALSALLFSVIAFDAPVTGAQQPQVGRQIQFERGRRIIERLRETDTNVTVSQTWIRPSIRFPPNSDYTYAEWKVEHADVIVVARIGSMNGVLTNAGDWVDTRATAVVVEPFKVDSTQQLPPGRTFVFTTSGGDTNIDGKRVRGVLEGVEPVRVGRLYLLLGDIGANGLLSVRPDNIYEITDDTVRSADRADGDPVTQLGGPSQVLAEIRRYVAAPRRNRDGGAR